MGPNAVAMYPSHHAGRLDDLDNLHHVEPASALSYLATWLHMDSPSGGRSDNVVRPELWLY